MQTSHLHAKPWEGVSRIIFICSHLEPLDIFISANIIWILLGWTVKGAVSYDSTE